MRRINPAVQPHAEARDHAVRVFFIAKRAEENGALVSFFRAAIILRVFEKKNVRDAPRDAAVFVRHHASGQIQFIGKHRDLVRAAIAVRVFQNSDRVLGAGRARAFRIRPARLRHRERILARAGDPEASARVEGHVHRLAADLRLVGEKLNFKPVRHMQGSALLVG